MRMKVPPYQPHSEAVMQTKRSLLMFTRRVRDPLARRMARAFSLGLGLC